MERFADEVTEEIYWTRFAPRLHQHLSVKAHKILRPLVAARGLQDVGIFRANPALQERARAPRRRGGKQMAFDLSLGRRGGAVRNQVREALTDRRVAA